MSMSNINVYEPGCVQGCICSMHSKSQTIIFHAPKTKIRRKLVDTFPPYWYYRHEKKLGAYCDSPTPFSFQVCEVYRLHRETFYLATDFVDRYMSLRDNVQKYQLQLIGVTALFIAAKLEVISKCPQVLFLYCKCDYVL